MSVQTPFSALGRLTAMRNVIRAVNPETLMLSRKTCHTANLASIVISEQNGRLIRVYLASPGHRLGDSDNRENQFTVGAHDHRYNLTLNGHIGAIRNDMYRLSDDGILTNRYAVCQRTGNRRFEGVERIERFQSIDLTDSWVTMNAEEIHVVTVNSPYGSWTVSEGGYADKELTLYNNASPEAEPVEGFDSVEDVYEFVDGFVSAASEWLESDTSQANPQHSQRILTKRNSNNDSSKKSS